MLSSYSVRTPTAALSLHFRRPALARAWPGIPIPSRLTEPFEWLAPPRLRSTLGRSLRAGRPLSASHSPGPQTMLAGGSKPKPIPAGWAQIGLILPTPLPPTRSPFQLTTHSAPPFTASPIPELGAISIIGFPPFGDGTESVNEQAEVIFFKSCKEPFRNERLAVFQVESDIMA